MLRVSIHAPRTGRDSGSQKERSISSSVSIHAPRTGRDICPYRHEYHQQAVSIHAPRTGRDAKNPHTVKAYMRFQSTRPARGATGAIKCFVPPEIVSIHAPRTGRDSSGRRLLWILRCFNPRAPHGARQVQDASSMTIIPFQSTRPARGATTYPLDESAARHVSIHAPRTGRDHLTRLI